MKALYILYKQNRLSNIILTIASIIFFAIVYFVILHSTYTSSPSVAGKSLIGQNRYNISVLEKSPSVENLYNFNKTLQADEQITVYTATPVDLLIKDFSGSTTFAPVDAKEIGDLSPVYGIQMNKAAEKMNDITMDTGRFFTANEFKDYKTTEVMPILLGSNYFNLYDIDEIIQMQVFGQNITAKIVGFLESDQIFVTVNLAQMSAGSQVVIPAQNYTKTPKEEDEFAKQSLMASANSMIVTNASKIGIRDIMLNVSQQSNYWNFLVGGSGGFDVNLYNTIIKENPAVVYSLFIAALLAMSILLVKLQKKRNKNNELLFRILSYSGMSAKQIEKYMLIEISSILLIGIVIPIIPFLVVSQLAFITCIMYIILSLILSLLFIILVRKKMVIETE